MKQGRNILFRNSYARVLDFKAQLVATQIVFRKNPQQNFSLLSKLEGIAQEINQHLAQPVHIPKILLMSNGGINLAKHPHHLFLTSQSMDGNELVDFLFKVKGLLVQGHLVGFYAAEIQQIIHQDHQALGRGINELHILQLFVLQTGVEQKLAHAHHRVHGGTDFMADHGQEVSLGLVGRFSLRGNFLQLAVLSLQLFDLLLQAGNGFREGEAWILLFHGLPEKRESCRAQGRIVLLWSSMCGGELISSGLNSKRKEEGLRSAKAAPWPAIPVKFRRTLHQVQ